MSARIALAFALSVLVLWAQNAVTPPYPWFIFYDGLYRGATGKTFGKMLREQGAITESGEGFKVSMLNDLPEPCSPGWARYVPDAEFPRPGSSVTNGVGGTWGTGLLPLYVCDSSSHWGPWGFQGDGTGVFVTRCNQPGFCLIGPNTAIIDLVLIMGELQRFKEWVQDPNGTQFTAHTQWGDFTLTPQQE